MPADDRKPSVIDSIVSGIGDAITDIRQKVVEEAYFGRVVTDTPSQSPYAEQGLPGSFENYRAGRDPAPPAPAPEQDKGKDIGE